MEVKVEERIIECYERLLIAIFSGIFSGRKQVSEVKPGIDENLLISRCNQVLETLPKNKMKKVIRLRFGLEDGKTKTLKETGQEFYLTREGIRQIEAKALRLMRHPSRSKYLREFIVLRNG